MCHWVVLSWKYLGLMPPPLSQDTRDLKDGTRDYRAVWTGCPLLYWRRLIWLRKICEIHAEWQTGTELGVGRTFCGLRLFWFVFGFDSDCLHKRGNIIVVTTVNCKAVYQVLGHSRVRSTMYYDLSSRISPLSCPVLNKCDAALWKELSSLFLSFSTRLQMLSVVFDWIKWFENPSKPWKDLLCMCSAARPP